MANKENVAQGDRVLQDLIGLNVSWALFSSISVTCHETWRSVLVLCRVLDSAFSTSAKALLMWVVPGPHRNASCVSSKR